MLWADSSRLGRPFAKDPCVIRFRNRYLLYFSLPGPAAPGAPPGATGSEGWAVGIAESTNLIDWRTIAEVPPQHDYERKGLAAPFAKVIGEEVHLFYQTYGNREKDAICHAVSKDGLRFVKNETNPIFHPTGKWNAGRAIDAELVEFRGRWMLYAATRDPAMKIQMLTGAWAEKGRGFSRGVWTMLADAPLLKPELPWEKDCIEAPSIVRRGNALYMFYAGGYNNAPQQIGCARSINGVHWERLFTQPFLPNGKPGSWNASESGHPGVFTDTNGQTYLFFQGNNDNGRTWYLSWVKVAWKGDTPTLIDA